MNQNSGSDDSVTKDSKGESTAELSARWFDREDSSGPTRKELVLQKLRSDCLKGSASRDRQFDLRCIQLNGEDLSGLDLSGYDFSGANLSKVILTGNNLVRCNFEGAILQNANFDGCELLGANLRGADLTEASAERAGFGNADFYKATLFAGNFVGATFGRATLSHADLRAANFQGARFREAQCDHVDFSKSNLSFVDFEEANIANSNLNTTDLRQASLKRIKGFDKASWIGADIRNVDFCGAYLVRRFIMDENYLYEFRTQSKYHEFLYTLWWLTSDCGRSFSRWMAMVALIVLLFAGLYQFVDVDYGSRYTAFAPLYYSVVTLTTLGYGDIVPNSAAAQILAVVEAVLGYMALGGALSIFANKIARRAD